MVKVKLKFVGFEEGDRVVEAEGTYAELLSKLGINPETVIVIKDSTPIPIDEKVEGGEVTVMRVISGG